MYYTLYILSDHNVYIPTRRDQIITEIVVDAHDIVVTRYIFSTSLLLVEHTLFKLLALPCCTHLVYLGLFAADNNCEIIISSVLGSWRGERRFSVRKSPRFLLTFQICLMDNRVYETSTHPFPIKARHCLKLRKIRKTI